MKRVIFNRKGGVGKSTITCNLAAVAASRGKQVLVIDLDPQANTTSYLGHSGKDDVVGIAEFFESTITRNYRKFTADDFIRETPYENLSLISSSYALVEIENCLLPYDCSVFARDAMVDLVDELDEIIDDHNPTLFIEGVVVNQFQSRAKLPQEAVDELTKSGFKLLQPFISSSVKVKESHSLSKPMVYLDSSHKVTLQFVDLYKKISRKRRSS